MADSPDIFEVQKVLSRRRRRGNVEYLIRWKDYGSEFDSWEPQGALIACRLIVNLYNKRHDYPLMGTHGETIRPKKSTNSSKIVAKARLNKAKRNKPSANLHLKKHTKLKDYPVRSRQNSLSSSVGDIVTVGLDSKVSGTDEKGKTKIHVTCAKKGTIAKKLLNKNKKPVIQGLKTKAYKIASATKSKGSSLDDSKVKSGCKVKVKKLEKNPKTKSVGSSEVKINKKVRRNKTKTTDAVDGCKVNKKVKVKVADLPEGRPDCLSDESSDYGGDSDDEDYVRYMLAPALLKELETKEQKMVSKRPASGSCHGQIDGPKKAKIILKKCDKKKDYSQTIGDKKKLYNNKTSKIEKKGNGVRRISDCSSRGKTSPKAAGKLLPLKPLHVKTEFTLPVSVPKAPVSNMESKLLIPASLDFAAIYKTPPTSPQLTRSASNTPSRPSTPVHNGYLADLPTVPLVPTLPSSPSTDSYLSLTTDLPQKLQASKLMRRVGLEDADEEVKRRVSVRQSESAFKYRDIVVKKCTHYTQIWLFTNTKFRNALNPHVFQELISAFHNAKYDDSRLVMLSGTGRIFCSGIDLFYLLSEDRKSSVNKMVASLREFIKTLISFPKPIVAAVNGPAIGLGAAILPLCDIVYASDKAEFYMPYPRLAQTPEGCASFTFPNVMGLPLANEMLLGGRKLTAIEAYQNNLVSQVYWPTSMMQEVIPKVESMAKQSAKALEATKLMVRSHLKAKMDYTNESECNMVYESWSSTEFQRAIKKYLEEEEELLH